MRIDNTLPQAYLHTQISASARVSVPDANSLNTSAGRANPGLRIEAAGVILDISPEGWAAYKSGIAGESGSANLHALDHRCETCDSRRYQDDSDDPSVSFQTPTHIRPEQSAAMVRSHEYEHVANEQTKADRDGRRVISQGVTLASSICPECNRPYISGGTTRTVTADDNRETPEISDLGQSE